MQKVLEGEDDRWTCWDGETNQGVSEFTGKICDWLLTSYQILLLFFWNQEFDKN